MNLLKPIKRILLVARVAVSNAGTGAGAPIGDLRVLQTDNGGNLLVAIGSGTGGIVGGATVANTLSDAVVTSDFGMETRSFNYALDVPTTKWARCRSTDDNTDSQATATIGIPLAGARNFGFNGAGWDRLKSVATNADNLSSQAKGAQLSASCLFLFKDSNTNWDRARSLPAGDGITIGGNFGGALVVGSQPYGFNETNSDQWRNNANYTLLASAARTVLTDSADQTNFNSRGLHCLLNVTAVPGSGSITLAIQGKDPVSGTYYDILVSPAVTTTGITILKVYPGIGALANAAAPDILPRTWRAEVRVGNASSYTYSVGAALVV